MRRGTRLQMGANQVGNVAITKSTMLARIRRAVREREAQHAQHAQQARAAKSACAARRSGSRHFGCCILMRAPRTVAAARGPITCRYTSLTAADPPQSTSLLKQRRFELFVALVDSCASAQNIASSASCHFIIRGSRYCHRSRAQRGHPVTCYWLRFVRMNLPVDRLFRRGKPAGLREDVRSLAAREW
jgi:hypothetical protein